MTSTRPSTSSPIHRRDPLNSLRTVCNLSTATLGLMTSSDPANVTCEACRLSAAKPAASEEAGGIAVVLQRQRDQARRERDELQQHLHNTLNALAQLKQEHAATLRLNEACAGELQAVRQERDRAVARRADTQAQFDEAIRQRDRAQRGLNEAASELLTPPHQGPPGHVTHRPSAARPEPGDPAEDAAFTTDEKQPPGDYETLTVTHLATGVNPDGGIYLACGAGDGRELPRSVLRSEVTCPACLRRACTCFCHGNGPGTGPCSCCEVARSRPGPVIRDLGNGLYAAFSPGWPNLAEYSRTTRLAQQSEPEPLFAPGERSELLLALSCLAGEVSGGYTLSTSSDPDVLLEVELDAGRPQRLRRSTFAKLLQIARQQ